MVFSSIFMKYGLIEFPNSVSRSRRDDVVIAMLFLFSVEELWTVVYIQPSQLINNFTLDAFLRK